MALIIIGAAMWAALPVGLYFVALSRSDSLRLSPPTSTWVPVEAASGQIHRTETLTLAWTPPLKAVAPPWSGTVQAVNVSMGDNIQSGDQVAVVDGIARLAWALDVPLYRPIGLDDRGDDVTSVNKLLADLGFQHGSDNHFSSLSLAGTRELAIRLGLPDGGKVDAFDPAWIVYLPATNRPVVSVDLVVAGPAPGAGITVFTLAPSVAAATLPNPIAEDESVAVAGQELKLSDDFRSLDPTGLTALLPLVATDAESVSASIATPSTGRWEVPAAAVVTDAAGAMCVLVRRDDLPTNAMEVTTGGAAEGRVVVSGELRATDRVRVFPQAEDRSCD